MSSAFSNISDAIRNSSADSEVKIKIRRLLSRHPLDDNAMERIINRSQSSSVIANFNRLMRRPGVGMATGGSRVYAPSPHEEFENAITYHTMVHEQLINFYRGFRRDAHPMAIMIGVVGALSSFYPDSTNINDPYERLVSSRRMIAKIPTIAAMAYKYSLGQPFNYPQNDLTYAENFLHMCFSVPAEKYKIDPIIARAMDKILILHADHEQNASASTVRIAGSSGANPFACIAAGIASLWGPAHGGANEAVLKMLSEIATVNRIDEFVNKAKDKNDPFRLFGFGHRVYKNYDPRAAVMRVSCHEVLNLLGIKNDPL